MRVQKSYKNDSSIGCLYVVPTPIGNLKDITMRALEVLKEVDLVLAEDTRHTRRLFQHFEIEQSMQSLHEHNTLDKLPYVLERLDAGHDIALVSDAGMPAISDPGYELVRAAVADGYQVITLPGANAALVALVSSGLPTDRFYFYGFLPKKKMEKEKSLEELSTIKATLIFYESPYRIKDTIKAIHHVLGQRHVSIAREITKLHEEYIRGTAEEVLAYLEGNNLKGECCLVVEGNTRSLNHSDPQNFWGEMDIQGHVAYYEAKGLKHKEAMKSAAKDRGISKRDVYQAIHVNK